MGGGAAGSSTGGTLLFSSAELVSSAEFEGFFLIQQQQESAYLHLAEHAAEGRRGEAELALEKAEDCRDVIRGEEGIHLWERLANVIDDRLRKSEGT